MNDDTIMQTAPSPIDMKHLSQLARLYSSGAIADEFRQSLPFPTMARGELTIGYFFFPAQNRPRQSTLLAPPCRRVWVQRDGSFVVLEAVSPEDFNLPDKPDEAVGELAMPEGMSAVEYTELHARLLDLLGRAIDAYGRNPASFPWSLDGQFV